MLQAARCDLLLLLCHTKPGKTRLKCRTPQRQAKDEKSGSPGGDMRPNCSRDMRQAFKTYAGRPLGNASQEKRRPSMLCCNILYYAFDCSNTLYHTLSYDTDAKLILMLILALIIYSNLMYYIALYYTLQYYMILDPIIPYCTIPQHSMHHNIAYYTKPFHTILYSGLV